MPLSQSPIFNFTQLGLGIESAGYGVNSAPTIWLSATDVDFHGVNNWDERASARLSIGMEEALAGPWSETGAFTIECDPDTIGHLCALVMGSEQVAPNSLNAGATPLAYDHTYYIQTPRKTFTAEWYRRADILRILGNKIGSLEFSFQPRQLVTARIATTAQTELNQGSAGVATFTAVKPFRFTDGVHYMSIAGVDTRTGSGMLNGTVTINTGLQPGEQVYGGGRFISNVPEGVTRVTAQFTMQFLDQVLQQRMWSDIGATSPGSDVVGVPIVIQVYSRSKVNTNVNYALRITMPYCKITQGPTAGRSGGLLQQTISVIAMSSQPAAADDISIVVTDARSTAT